jgi:hypothetical protein
MAEPELAVGTSIASQTAYNDLVEEVVLRVRNSAAVQEARTETFLDAAILAALQVHDVRLQALETPAEVTGWEFFGDLLLTLILESNVIGMALKGITKTIFKSVLRTNAVFRALPKSPRGHDLLLRARAGARAWAHQYQATPAESHAFQRDVIKLGGLSSENPLPLYHRSIRELVEFGSDEGVISAGAKTVVQFARSPKPWAEPARVTDSATVAVVSFAQDYARATRLGIRITHATIESYIRRGAFTLDQLVTLVEAVGWEPLTDAHFDERTLRLADLRNEYALLFEALIWARMYGFSESPDFPPLLQREDAFDRVNEYVQTYWRRRFQTAADDYLVNVKGATVVRNDTTQSLRLRRYFAALSLELTKQVTKQKLGPNAFEPMRPQTTAP